MITNWLPVLRKYLQKYRDRLFSIAKKEIGDPVTSGPIFRFFYRDPSGIVFFNGETEIIFFPNDLSPKKYILNQISDYRQFTEIFKLIAHIEERGTEESNYAKFLTSNYIELREFVKSRSGR